MNILVWILFGLIAGAIAKFIMPGKENMGWIMTILLGVAGSFLGGFIGSLVLNQPVGGTNEFSFANLGLAIVGALLVLVVAKQVKKMKDGGGNNTPKKA